MLMIREILPNIYTFEVVLPNSPLKALNSYIIKGKDRSLLFDTGYNRPESKEALLSGLSELQLEPKDVDVVLTHLHADHTGLINLFVEAGSKVYAGKVDGHLTNQMANGEYWQLLESFLPIYGIEENEITIDDNPGYRFKLDKAFDFIPLEIGGSFKFEDYSFEILDLIGHTPGHIGLYDRDKQIIFSADTVLDPMTPNISYWGPNYPNILKSYIETLGKLKGLDIQWCMATHRQLIQNPNQRIDEIIEHHYDRMQEILDVMKPDQTYSTREIAANITWRIRANGWDEFPKGQKWFALGETLVHLEFLVDTGHLCVKENNQTLYFSKLKDKI